MSTPAPSLDHHGPLLDAFAAALKRVHRPEVSRLFLADWPDTGRHRHDIPTAIGCLSGSLRISLSPNQHLDIGAGELVVIPPALIHMHHHQRLPHVAIDLGLFPAVADLTVSDLDRSVVCAIDRSLVADRLYRLASESGELRRLTLARDLLRTLAAAPRTPFAIPDPVKHMLARIWWQSHWPTLEAAGVLAASGLGATRARERFETAIGLAPKTYLTRFRLGVAKGLMDAGWSMEDAARAAGFTEVIRLRRNARRHRDLLTLEDRRKR